MNIVSNMKTITMVELLAEPEQVVRELKQGQHFKLINRGEKIAEIVPSATVVNSQARDALRRLKERHAGDAEHAREVDRYGTEVYEARRAGGIRSAE